MTDLSPPPPTQTKSKGKGCLLAGCGGCLGVIVLGAIAFSIAFHQIKKQFQEPPFEPMELTAGEQTVLDAKMRQLSLDGNVEQAPASLRAPIVISEREINAWFIAKNPDLADVVRIHLGSDTLTAEMRIGDGNKRFATRATLRLVQNEDNLFVELKDVRLGSFKLPEALLQNASKEELTGKVFGDAESLARFRSVVERIEIRQGEFLIVPKAR